MLGVTMHLIRQDIGHFIPWPMVEEKVGSLLDVAWVNKVLYCIVSYCIVPTIKRRRPYTEPGNRQNIMALTKNIVVLSALPSLTICFTCSWGICWVFIFFFSRRVSLSIETWQFAPASFVHTLHKYRRSSSREKEKKGHNFSFSFKRLAVGYFFS